MGQALYRKYRSKSLDDIVGQEHVTKTLQQALKNGKISHAYLFTGPRGVGKTSIARILAHEVNGLEYKDESLHLDIIEIDAASNRRIDEIRDLRERVHITPTSAKYKVYIIDEVHMLTREAFNALLKTLEEPPAHCIFILATTEAHKLPETIISRTQHFSFKPLQGNESAKRLATIAKEEKIDIEPSALDLLAEHGSGSLRDSIGLLDQLAAAGKNITEKDALEFLGLPKQDALQKLIEDVSTGNSQSLLELLEDLRLQGLNPVIVAREVAKILRNHLTSGDRSPWIASLLKELVEVSASTDPQDYLEICLLQAAAENTPNEPPKEPVQADPEPVVVKEESQAAPVPKPTKLSEFSLEDWPVVLAEAKKADSTLYTGLRLAQPSLQNGVLSLGFQFPLHQKKIANAANLDKIAGIIEKLSKSSPQIRAVVDKSLSPAVETEPQEIVPEDDQALQSINNIFGQTEMLES